MTTNSRDRQSRLWFLYWSIAGLLLFSLIAFSVQRGFTQQFDDAILRTVHDLASRADRPGRLWGEESIIAVTSLGALVILVCASVGVMGFLLLTRNWRPCVFILIALLGGIGFNYLLKPLFGRIRPVVVPHAQYVDSKSFPSGHALISTTVYVALGAVGLEFLREKRLRLYLLGITFSVPFFIGISRIYLGVHYPTDVLAGWLLGAVWVGISRKLARALTVAADASFGEK